MCTNTGKSGRCLEHSQRWSRSVVGTHLTRGFLVWTNTMQVLVAIDPLEWLSNHSQNRLLGEKKHFREIVGCESPQMNWSSNVIDVAFRYLTLFLGRLFSSQILGHLRMWLCIAIDRMLARSAEVGPGPEETSFFFQETLHASGNFFSAASNKRAVALL